MLHTDDKINISMHIVATISSFSSLCVILCYLTSKEIRHKSYNALIYCLAVCDFFSGLALALGETKDKSALCWVQGLMTNYFPLAGVFWTGVIGNLLYKVTGPSKNKNVNVFSNSVFVMCWFFPMVLTLLPLTTNSYGVIEEDGKSGWCFIVDRSDSPFWTAKFWTIQSFYLWMWLAVIIYCYYMIFTYIAITELSASMSQPLIRKALYRLPWYPLNVVICWSYTCYVDIYTVFYGHSYLNDGLSAYLSYTLPLYLGLLNSIAFFCSSNESRQQLFLLAKFTTKNDTLLGEQRTYDREEEEYDELSDVVSFGSFMDTYVVRSMDTSENLHNLSFTGSDSMSNRGSETIHNRSKSQNSSRKSAIEIY
jgi:hypothetical protein